MADKHQLIHVSESQIVAAGFTMGLDLRSCLVLRMPDRITAAIPASVEVTG